MMLRLYMLICSALLLSCNDKQAIPGDILPPEKMQAVYWDYMKADVYANEFMRKDSSKNVALENARLQLEVFKIHKVSKEDFYRSYDYYLAHKDLMKDMLDTMLVRQTKVVIPKKDSVSMGIDTVTAKAKDSAAVIPQRRRLDSIKSIL